MLASLGFTRPTIAFKNTTATFALLGHLSKSTLNNAVLRAVWLDCV